MTDIDWSKAPEGATHYYDKTGEWYKVAGSGDAMAWTGSWVEATMYGYRAAACIPRPAPSWNGTGLPPVGMNLECSYSAEDFGAWHKGECISRGKSPEGIEICVIKSGKTVALYRSSEFLRPIRTPQQIAADERQYACEEMLAVTMARRSDPDVFEAISTLYDAGYRKP